MRVIDVHEGDLLVELARQVKHLGLEDAAVVAGIGVVDSFKLLTTSAKNERLSWSYEQPGEIASLNGFVREGRAHLHASLGLPGSNAVAGDLAQATVGLHFVRLFLSPVTSWPSEFTGLPKQERGPRLHHFG